jgi:hypothetical protein
LYVDCSRRYSGDRHRNGGFRTISEKRSRYSSVLDDPVSLGEPLSYWLKVIRERNTEELGMAFDAIVELGPAASAAVPELTQIVAEPFTPIRLGRDDKREVLSKLRIIFMKGGCHRWSRRYRQKASPSARSVIEWSLTNSCSSARGPRCQRAVHRTCLDGVMERMRGAGTVANSVLVRRLQCRSDGVRRQREAEVCGRRSQ